MHEKKVLDERSILSSYIIYKMRIEGSDREDDVARGRRTPCLPTRMQDSARDPQTYSNIRTFSEL